MESHVPFLQVMPDDGVWIHSIFHLHSKAQFAQNFFVHTHINKLHLYFTLGRK